MSDGLSYCVNALEWGLLMKENPDYIYVEKKRTKFLGLPLYFTRYSIGEDKLNIRRGFLNIVEDDTYMYKVQDVELITSLMERIFGLGTVVCYTGDTTHPRLDLVQIKNAKEVKNFILEASEQARMKRRTMNTLDIGADVEEMDGDE